MTGAGHARAAGIFLAALLCGGGGTTGAEPGLRGQVGRRVVLMGRVSRIPEQHMIRADMHKGSAYIDLDGWGQIVVYSRGDIDCGGPVLLRGELLLTEGSSKRPGSKEVCSEVQLDVESWRCLSARVIEDLIGDLADPKTPQEARAGIEEDLVAAGREAIPALIAHLKDGRTCRTVKALLNEGELMNRPAGAPAVAERWAEVAVSVGKCCEDLLLRIVTPVGYESPYAGNFKAFSPASHPFRVENWTIWWKQNRERSLEEIRESLKPVIDAYWKSHGVQQVLR